MINSETDFNGFILPTGDFLVHFLPTVAKLTGRNVLFSGATVARFLPEMSNWTISESDAAYKQTIPSDFHLRNEHCSSKNRLAKVYSLWNIFGFLQSHLNAASEFFLIFFNDYVKLEWLLVTSEFSSNKSIRVLKIQRLNKQEYCELY